MFLHMGFTVGVAGASGYAGGELLRLLHGHPDIQLGPLAAGESAGRPVTDLHPQLLSLKGRTFVGTDASAFAGVDALIVALPHGRSAQLAASLPVDLPIVDLGADHRLHSPAEWQKYYDGPFAQPWAYGVPELPGQRDHLRGTSRIAGAGCHATAIELAVAPLLAAGLIEPADMTVVSVTGTTGAGRGAGAALTSAQVMGDSSAYKVGRHQHTAEILQTLGPAVTLSFTPVLAPMPRGILATCTARTAATEDQLQRALHERYDDEPFVTVLDGDHWPHTSATLGSNSVQLRATRDTSAGRAVVVSALDNLGKGAAGQAVQCLNLALGLHETAGLTADGVWP